MAPVTKTAILNVLCTVSVEHELAVVFLYTNSTFIAFYLSFMFTRQPTVLFSLNKQADFKVN